MTSSSLPRATVLLPVYNGAVYLRPALDSVLSQDSADFELLAIDDGSSDESGEILREYAAADRRLRVISHKKNARLIATLNEGLDEARGEYVIRMDADDVCLPGRFAKQVAFMDAHPEVAVSGGWAWVIDAEGRRTGGAIRTLTGYRLRHGYWKPSPVVHPTAILRRSALGDRRFRAEALHAEDYDFWLQFGREGRLANLPDYLLEYRVHPGGVSVAQRRVQLETSYAVFNRFLGSSEIGFEEFRSLFDVPLITVPAYVRLQRRLAKRLAYPLPAQFLDFLGYAFRWSRSKPMAANAS